MLEKQKLKLRFENDDTPSQEDFWEWQDSYWHKEEQISQQKIENLQTDLNKKLDKPLTGSGFYIMTQNGDISNFSKINLSSSYLPYWNGSGFTATNIYYNSGKVGIGTENQPLTEALEVNGTVKTKNLVATALPDAQGNSQFTKHLVAKPDGTIGVENKSNNYELNELSYMSELAYTQDSSNYYIRGTVYLCMKDAIGGNAGVGNNLRVFVNNSVVSDITADRDNLSTNHFSYEEGGSVFNISQMILPFTITISKSLHPESYWTSGYFHATVVSTHTSFNNTIPVILQKSLKLKL